jgi:hypothetical protein
MASFKVKPEKVITYFGWLPDGDAIGQTLSCAAAETMREELFQGRGLIAEEVAKATTVPSPLKVERDRLASRVQELRALTTLD